MPNDKDHDLSQEEGSEEKKYSFLRETIKPKPISREQLAKQLVRIAIYGVILGVFACLGFFALKPLAQNWFRGEVETVTIPEDEDPSEEDTGNQEAEETSAPVADAQTYEEMLASMKERAEEAGKGIVSVKPVLEEEDWGADITGISAAVTGVITADNGQELLILADSSVCELASKWTATFRDGKTYNAALKKQDKNTHMAVFSVPRGNISDSTWAAVKVSTLGNSNLVKQGDVVIALGNMFGYADGMAYGVISSTEYKTAFFDGECDILATDISTESEGTGVLFNMDGEVIGMISSSIWTESENSMVNAYAVSDMKPIIELLANGQSVPYIGVYGTTVTSQLTEEQGIPSGVYVVDVDPDSPAMAAGIQIGDVICGVSGNDTGNIVAYQRAVLETKAGEQVKFKGKRLGAEGYVDVDFTVTVGSKE